MVERDKVVKLINTVIAKVEHHGDPYRGQLRDELMGLQAIIDRAREELRSTKIGDIHAKHIPTATDELDAIVKATEGATLEIFSACESIERVLPETSDAHRTAIQTDVTRIYEACSFQDITGQRINKVVRSIKDIEEKVGGILKVINERMGDMNLHESISEDTRTGDAALMNGPQMPDKAITQADIDKLLAEFDN